MATLTPPDYLVFAAVLSVSAGVGVYYKLTSGRQRTVSEYLLGDRRMSVLPVSMSLLASFMSAVTLLGTPAETYVYGTMFSLICVAFCLAVPVVCHVFLPVLYPLRLTSVYEYLEMRFNAAVRLVATILFIVTMALFLAVVLYGPALALSSVSNLNLYVSIVVVGAVCTFYTTLGGIKAVMWTDAFQIIIMFAGVVVVIVKGCIDHGGLGNIFAIANEGGRIEFSNWSPSPLERHTVPGVVLGAATMWLSLYGSNQAQVQRQLAVPHLRHAQLAMYVNLAGLLLLNVLVVTEGLALYAAYRWCDPLSSGRISARDQLVPLYAVDKLRRLRGLPGLVVACVFSGSLSTISSGVNSLSAVLVKDVIGKARPGLGEQRTARLSEGLALVFGLLCIALAFLASLLGGILQLAYAVLGLVGSPVCGVFLLGMLNPRANSKGALAGLVTGTVVNLWLGAGSVMFKPAAHTKPMNVSGCAHNVTLPVTGGNSTLIIERDSPWHLTMYDVSYMWYAPIGVLVTCLIGVIVSLATERESVDPRLLVSCLRSRVHKHDVIKYTEPRDLATESHDLLKQRDSRDLVTAEASRDPAQQTEYNRPDSRVQRKRTV